jgi:hypothetical protein
VSLRPLLRTLLNPGIYAGALISCLLVVSGYQSRPTQQIIVGSPTDAPLLDGFSGSERVPEGVDLGYQTFRWLSGYGRVTFTDLGAQPYSIKLTVNGSRPPDTLPPALTAQVSGEVLLQVQPPPGVETYTIAVPPSLLDSQRGSFTLELSSNTFQVPGDARELGIIVTRIGVQPTQAGPGLLTPPIPVLAFVTLAAVVAGVLLSLLGWWSGVVGLGASLPGLLAGGLLVLDRLWLTTGEWYALWPGVLLLGGAVVTLAWLLGGWLLRQGGVVWSSMERMLLLTFLLAAFVFRLAGQLHPQIFVYDLGFHLNHLRLVQTGQLLFTNAPAEFGGTGHETFYLPTAYLFAMPLDWLLADGRLAIRLLTVLLGTLGVLPIYYIARRLLRDGRAGVLAALLYVSLPMSVLPYSWGITPNLLGEFFMLCSLAVALGSAGNLAPARPAFWALVILLTITLLSHPGVVALSGVAFGLVGILWAARRGVERRAGAWLLVSLVLSAGISYAVYYHHFTGQMLDSLARIGAERAQASQGEGFSRVVGGSVEDASLGLINREVRSRSQWVLGGLEGVWREAVAYYRGWPVLAAFLGLALVLPARRFLAAPRRRERLRFVLAGSAWLAVVALFAIVGWATSVYVRYMLSGLPIVALGAGLLLSGVWRKGSSGRLLSLLVVVFFAVEAMLLWHYRISYQFK